MLLCLRVGGRFVAGFQAAGDEGEFGEVEPRDGKEKEEGERLFPSFGPTVCGRQGDGGGDSEERFLQGFQDVGQQQGQQGEDEAEDDDFRFGGRF